MAFSDNNPNSGNTLTSYEKLKATEKYLAKMNDVLSTMDEISRIKRANGDKDADSDEIGGYKRSSVVKLVSELEKQREMLLSAIEREKNEAVAAKEKELSVKEKEIEELKAREAARTEKDKSELLSKKEAELAEKERELMRLRAERAAHEEKLSREQKEKQEAIRARDEALKAKEEALKMQAALALREQELATLAPAKNDNAVTSFRKGDNALAIEGLYTGLSMDIEKMRDDILQEMKYSYKQDISIYDDLAEKIESIKTIDANTLEEGLKPLQVLNTLDEKLNALQTVDYDCIVEKVSEKLTETKIDYDVLAERVAALMTSYAENAISPKMQLSAIEQRLEEMQYALSGIMSVKQMPEFRKLDPMVEEYLRTLSYDTIPDILILSDEIRKKANRHIAGGNTLRGEGMLADLGARLRNVALGGYGALVVIEDTIKTHSLPKTLSDEAFAEFKEACAELERSPAVCGDELVGKVVRTKKALLNDVDLAQFDNDTMGELLEIFAEIPAGELPSETTIVNIGALKKELMSFNLSYFVELEPVAAQPEKTDNVDTQAILEAISNIKIPEAVAIVSQPVAAAKEPTESKLEEVKKDSPNVRVKKARVLRPAVSSKDNKTEKVVQPLRVVRRSIKASEENPDALSKALVGQVAQKIANSMIK